MTSIPARHLLVRASPMTALDEEFHTARYEALDHLVAAESCGFQAVPDSVAETEWQYTGNMQGSSLR